MEKRYYIDGKCVLSYDDDVFSTDEAGMNAWREELDFFGTRRWYDRTYLV